MNKNLFFRLILCFIVSCSLLYCYVNKQNDLMKLRLKIPSLWAEYRQLEQENVALGFLIDKLESPEHLMQIAELPDYAYLHYPTDKEICMVPKNF